MPALVVPSQVAAQWLFSVLSTDALLISLLSGSAGVRIFEGHPPQGLYRPVSLTYPCLVFAKYGPGKDDYVIGAVRIMSTLRYLVKVIGQTEDFEEIAPIAQQVDNLLQGQSGSVVSGRVAACIRDGDIDLNETADGVEFRHLGGIYTLLVQAN